jgi:hypothetical protein
LKLKSPSTKEPKSNYDFLVKLAIGLENSPRYNVLGYPVFNPQNIDEEKPDGTYFVRISHGLAKDIAAMCVKLYQDLSENAKH